MAVNPASSGTTAGNIKTLGWVKLEREDWWPRSEEGPEPRRWLADKMGLMARAFMERLCSVSWAKRLQTGCKPASWWRRLPAYSAQGHSRDGSSPRLCGQLASGPGWEGVVAMDSADHSVEGNELGQVQQPLGMLTKVVSPPIPSWYSHQGGEGELEMYWT